MKNIVLSLSVISMLFIAGCGQTGSNDKERIGSGIGGFIGGILGSKVGKESGKLWAVGAGTLLGSLAGSEIGRALDKMDRRYIEKAQMMAHDTDIGDTVRWNNPDSGHGGSITSVKEGYGEHTGNYCREYRQTIIIDGEEKTGYGTACQLSDGSWEII